MIGSSDLNAVAEGEANAAVGVDRRMIQQLPPGLRVECRHLLRQAAQAVNELLRCGLGGNQSGDLPGSDCPVKQKKEKPGDMPPADGQHGRLML